MSVRKQHSRHTEKDVMFMHNGIHFCISRESHLTKSTAYAVKKKIMQGTFYIQQSILDQSKAILINCIGCGAYDISTLINKQ